MAQRYLIEYILQIRLTFSSQTLGRKLQTVLIMLIHSSFIFVNIDESVVKKTINNLQAKSSSGCDGISSKLLKVIEPVIIKPLTLLINQVLNSGISPDTFKIAKVIPIYKKGDPSLFENYRPISLLPAISKVLEKIIALQHYLPTLRHFFLF